MIKSKNHILRKFTHTHQDTVGHPRSACNVGVGTLKVSKLRHKTMQLFPEC